MSNVITESQNSDNEDDDQFVVEAAPQLPEMSELEMVGEARCALGHHMPGRDLPF